METFDQGDLFAQERLGKLDGMKRAEDHADPVWSAAAEAVMMRLIRVGAPFTSGDAQLLMPEGVTTPEPRAWGPLITRFASQGLIRATGDFRTTGSHNRPQAVWEPCPWRAPS